MAQAAARVAWRQIAHVIEENVVVCRWVGLAVLLVQVACMGLAYALSSAQQRLLLDASMCALGFRVWASCTGCGGWGVELLAGAAAGAGIAGAEPAKPHVIRLNAVGVGSRDEEDEVWGRRRPLLSQGCGRTLSCIHVCFAQSVHCLPCTPTAYTPVVQSGANAGSMMICAGLLAVSLFCYTPVITRQALNPSLLYS